MDERAPGNRGEPFEERVLIHAPTGRDADLARTILEGAGLEARACESIRVLCQEIEHGAGVVIVAEEALILRNAMQRLIDVLERQPPWSDLPLIVFAGSDSREAATAIPVSRLGNVTVLERPTRVRTMMSVVQAALRTRRRQYQARNLLRQLEETDRRKDQFLAMLGHELRNPLSAIRMAVTLIEKEREVDRAKLERRMGVISRQSRNLCRIVDDLLEVSRVLRGKIELKRELVDLNGIIVRAEQVVSARSSELGKSVAVDRWPEPVLVDADPVRLEQVVVNLLDNAVKYTEDRGTIRVVVRRDVETASIRVEDDGAGIPADMLTSIFEAFTQVPATKSQQRGGLGLGLPLVKSLVELHGGRVSVSSDGLGRGSVFAVDLPVAALPAAATEDVAASQGTDPGDERLKVLIVEDNEDALEILTSVVERLGHQVRVATDGLAGFRTFQTHELDVALVDIGLPGMDGYEIARRVRAERCGRDIRLIAMTGFGQPEDKRRALAAGFDHHLVKPIELETLRDLLARPEG